MITQNQKRVNIPRKKAKFCAHRNTRDALTNGVFTREFDLVTVTENNEVTSYGPELTYA